MALHSQPQLKPRTVLTFSAALLLGACTASKPPLMPDVSGPAAKDAPARFPQPPELLALEKNVAQDAGVQAILKRRPGTRLKLRRLEGGHLSAYFVEQRDGRWFNISNQLSAAEQATIAGSVARVGEAAGWKSVGAQRR